jgi:hypothetical protein
MSSLQAYYSGAFSSSSSTPTLSSVLTSGNIASTDIDMNQNDIIDVASITNTTDPIILSASEGLSLNGSVGTVGQFLTSAGAGQPIWTTGGTTSIGLSEVLTTDNSAGTTSIDMNQQSIDDVETISNATSALTLDLPFGLSLNGSLGTSGQVLSSNVAGQPTWITPSASGTTMNYVGTVSGNDPNVNGLPIITMTALPIGYYSINYNVKFTNNLGNGATFGYLGTLVSPTDYSSYFVNIYFNDFTISPTTQRFYTANYIFNNTAVQDITVNITGGVTGSSSYGDLGIEATNIAWYKVA